MSRLDGQSPSRFFCNHMSPCTFGQSHSEYTFPPFVCFRDIQGDQMHVIKTLPCGLLRGDLYNCYHTRQFLA